VHAWDSSGNIWSVPLFGKISRCDMAKIALHWFVSTGRTQLICAKKSTTAFLFPLRANVQWVEVIFVKFKFSKKFTKIEEIFTVDLTLCKGQIKLKAGWRAVDFPKKRTNEFVLFAFLLFTVKIQSCAKKYIRFHF
jgi:hypothetical protein